MKYEYEIIKLQKVPGKGVNPTQNMQYDFGGLKKELNRLGESGYKISQYIPEHDLFIVVRVVE